MYTNVPDNVVDKDFFYLFYLKWLSSFMIILLRLISGWVDVEWDSGAKNSYRYGKDSAFDIKVTHTKHFLYSVVYWFVLKLKVWFEEQRLRINLTLGTNTLTIMIWHEETAMLWNAVPSVDIFSNRKRLRRE